MHGVADLTSVVGSETEPTNTINERKHKRRLKNWSEFQSLYVLPPVEPSKVLFAEILVTL